jgi:hypothetical protein
LIYATFLSGSEQDYGVGIAADAAGSAYVTGWMRAPDFPTVNAVQPTPGQNPSPQSGPTSNAFVSKIASPSPRSGDLRVTTRPITAVEGEVFSGIVAVFTDSDDDPAGSFTATVDWGDGTTSSGTISASAGGGFDVAAMLWSIRQAV